MDALQQIKKLASQGKTRDEIINALPPESKNDSHIHDLLDIFVAEKQNKTPSSPAINVGVAEVNQESSLNPASKKHGFISNRITSDEAIRTIRILFILNAVAVAPSLMFYAYTTFIVGIGQGTTGSPSVDLMFLPILVAAMIAIMANVIIIPLILMRWIKARDFSSRGKIFVLMAILVMSLFCLGAYTFSYIQEQQKDQAHEKSLNENIAALQKIEIINGKQTKPARVQDTLEMPAGGSMSAAQANFRVNGTLTEEAARVRSNLSRAGFISNEKPIEAGSTYSSNISEVTQKYNNGKDYILVSYLFKQEYKCPEDKVCGSDKLQASSGRQFDVNALSNEQLSAIEVYYISHEGS